MDAKRMGVVLALAATFAAAPSAHASGGGTVVVGPDGDDRYAPASVTVTAGEPVTWTWDDGGHNVEVDDPAEAFDTGKLGRGATFTRSFSTPGTYVFHCEYHADEGMKGTVTVRAASAPRPAEAPAPPQHAPAAAAPAVAPVALSAGSLDVVRPALRVAAARVTRSRTLSLSLRLSEDARLYVSMYRGLTGTQRIARFAGRAGLNRIVVSRHKLRPGRYRVRVIAVDRAGNRTTTRLTSLNVRR